MGKMKDLAIEEQNRLREQETGPFEFIDDIDQSELEGMEIDDLRDMLRQYKLAVQGLGDALREIQKGEGTYSHDQFEHCKNTVENMKAIATVAINKYLKSPE